MKAHFLQLMAIGVIGVNGANVQQTVVEDLRLEAEPAVTLHQLTEEQNVLEMLLKHSLATLTPVQVIFMRTKYKNVDCLVLDDLSSFSSLKKRLRQSINQTTVSLIRCLKR